MSLTLVTFYFHSWFDFLDGFCLSPSMASWSASWQFRMVSSRYSGMLVPLAAASSVSWVSGGPVMDSLSGWSGLCDLRDVIMA